jgi:hypothetical protein
LLATSVASAGEFDGWSLRQIRQHPDFVRDTSSMSSAFNTANPGGRRVYHWIGYIPVEDTRVYFTSYGEPLTCVLWQKSGEWVPQWAIEALDRLETDGYIKLNPAATTAEVVAAETPVPVEAATEAEVTVQAEVTTTTEVTTEAEPTVVEEVTTSAEPTVSESEDS